jgi:uncharacterized protein (DUF488 family)
VDARRIYTIGYEGFTLDGLVENLVQHRVAVVVDVRYNAVSRKPGFSKQRLSAALEGAGIEYRHDPRLGNPPENRAAFGSAATIEEGRDVMRRRLATDSRPAVEALAEETRARRVAVLCLERSTAACHRAVVLEAVSELDPELTVVPVL